MPGEGGREVKSAVETTWRRRPRALTPPPRSALLLSGPTEFSFSRYRQKRLWKTKVMPGRSVTAEGNADGKFENPVELHPAHRSRC